MPTLSNPELAEALEGANSLILRWGHNQMRQLKAEEVERIVAALKASASSETGPSEDEIERMLDNAACAAQEGGLLRDTDGTETPLREAVRLNVVNPLLRRSERPRHD